MTTRDEILRMIEDALLGPYGWIAPEETPMARQAAQKVFAVLDQAGVILHADGVVEDPPVWS